MAVQNNLAEFAGAQFDKHAESLGGNQADPDLTSQLPTVTPDPSSNGQAATNGQAKPEDGNAPKADDQAEQERSLADLGIEVEAKATETKEGEGTESGVAPGLDLKVPAETIIASLDGKELSAAELKAGYLRQSDYTKKTTEIAEYRKNAEPAVAFVRENLEPLQALEEAARAKETGNDEAAKQGLLKAFGLVAKQLGVEVDFAGAQSRERGPDGRFVASTPSDSEASLEAIADEFGKDSLQYKQAVEMQELRAKNDALAKRWQDFDEGLARARQNQQSREELETLHSQWESKGVKGIDLSKAQSLIGKQIDAQMALQLAGLPSILEWHKGKVDPSKRPNEPGTQKASGVDPAGMSLSRYANERIK